MRMTTLSKTHFQNAPTGQKSTGRQLPRHSGTVKLKWNFENKVGKTIDFLNRKTEKSWWKKWTESELPPSMPTSIALSCAKREICARHHPLPYRRQYINFVNLPIYRMWNTLFNWWKLETELPHLHVPGSKGCQWLWREAELYFFLLQWTTPWKSFLPASLHCSGEGGYPNWAAWISTVLWSLSQKCVYGMYAQSFLAYIMLW